MCLPKSDQKILQCLRSLWRCRPKRWWQILGVLIFVLVIYPGQPVFWPSGFGFGEGETIKKTVVQRDTQGNVTQSVETTIDAMSFAIMRSFKALSFFLGPVLPYGISLVFRG